MYLERRDCVSLLVGRPHVNNEFRPTFFNLQPHVTVKKEISSPLPPRFHAVRDAIVLRLHTKWASSRGCLLCAPRKEGRACVSRPSGPAHHSSVRQYHISIFFFNAAVARFLASRHIRATSHPPQ